MNDENYKLTTVKVLSENYTKFKVDSLTSNMTLQKLVNRAIEKYLTDKDFRSTLDNVELLRDNKKF
tara:strand:- start:7922 stop:8119 length:198 start_codon:yes stop_codon:yes gene_type:complete